MFLMKCPGDLDLTIFLIGLVFLPVLKQLQQNHGYPPGTGDPNGFGGIGINEGYHAGHYHIILIVNLLLCRLKIKCWR